jgi:hypothetical protein
MNREAAAESDDGGANGMGDAFFGHVHQRILLCSVADAPTIGAQPEEGVLCSRKP